MRAHHAGSLAVAVLEAIVLRVLDSLLQDALGHEVKHGAALGPLHEINKHLAGCKVADGGGRREKGS